MPDDLLDSLAELEAPPPPPMHFDREVHRRLNRRLLAGQALDFAFRALPFAAFHLLQAILGGLWYSLTGTYPQPPRSECDM